MNALFLVGIRSHTKSLERCLCRKIVLLFVATAPLGASAMANFKDFGVDSEACTCADIMVTGCFHVSSIAISYDLLVEGAKNGDILEARVSVADPPDSCLVGAELFTLKTVGGPDTTPAHLRGAKFLSSSDRAGTCPTDPGACITDLQGLVQLVWDVGTERADGPRGELECIRKIIKDIVPTCAAAPAVSEWGFVAMIVLVMIAGTIVFRRRAVAL